MCYIKNTNNLRSDTQSTITYGKPSFSSAIKEIRSMIVCDKSAENIKRLNMTTEKDHPTGVYQAIQAAPGWGKSTLIISSAKQGDLIIAMSTGALQTLSSKVTKKSGVTVASLEMAKLLCETQKFTNIYIDEAGLIHYTQLLQILPSITGNINLFGDITQIKHKFMYKHGGIFVETNVFD